MTPNTAITYLYRDASNYKYRETVVVAGPVRFADLQPFLDADAGDGNGFCPVDVGLPHPGVQGEGWPNEDDHCWCELAEDDFEPTDLAPTHGSATALIEKFRKAHAAGWPAQFREPE